MVTALGQPHPKAAEQLAEAARDKHRISGWTHNFYRYPARFSPKFAAAAIESFSRPGDLVLDPYMGGGTTVVEALVAGRRVVGNDLNALAAFVARVKTTLLEEHELKALGLWANNTVPTLTYRTRREKLAPCADGDKTKNLTLARARFIKKVIAVAMASLRKLPSARAQDFARCALLKAAQCALDGRRRATSASEFRAMLARGTHEMLEALREYAQRVAAVQGFPDSAVVLSQRDAAQVDALPIFSRDGERAQLVVTSPPYPGIHVLYHRWQVDGRRETAAPYWIADCDDGEGASFYNFGGRHETGLRSYFESSLKTLNSIRRTIEAGGYMVQMLAFRNPKYHLPRYLRNMKRAGFYEVFPLGRNSNGAVRRIWREVPGRKWHATMKGDTNSSREVVLVHRAI